MKDDSNKIVTLLVLSKDLLEEGDLNLSMKYANEALILSETLDYKHGEVTINKEIGNIFSRQSNYSQALECYFQALSVAERVGDKVDIASILGNIGIIYKNQGDYQIAIEYYYRALKIGEELQDKSSIARDLGNIGNVYNEHGDFHKAIEYYHQALKIGEEIGDKDRAARQNNNIGYVLYRKKEYAKALEYFDRALEFADELKDKEIKVAIYGNIGLVYADQDQDKNALEYYAKALALAEQIGDYGGQMIQLMHFGALYQKQLDLGKALETYKKAYRIAEISGNKKGVAVNLINIGSTYGAQSNLQEAEKYFKRSISVATEMGSFEDRIIGNSYLSELYAVKGEYEQALVYLKKATIAKDSLFEEKRDQRITRRELNYEFERKETAAKQVFEKSMAVEQEKQRNQRYLWIISILFLLVVGTLAFYFYRRKRNYLLMEQIASIKIEALNAQMSDHFISNTMSSINRFIEENEKEKASEYLLKFSRLIRQVLENSFKRTVTLREDIEIMEKYIDLEKLRFPKDVLHYSITLDENIDAESILVPPMILQVLAENSINHGFRKSTGGTIKLNVTKMKERVQFVMEDNGIGRVLSNMNKSDKHRLSIGSGLAERLLQAFNKSLEQSNLSIVDLCNEDNQPIGTRVGYTIPLKLVE